MATNLSDRVWVEVDESDRVWVGNVGSVVFRDTLQGVRFTAHARFFESPNDNLFLEGWIVQHRDHRADTDGPAVYRSPLYESRVEWNEIWNELRKALMTPVRRAVITQRADLDTVRAYLPHNYSAERNALDAIVIEGTDDAGWTLDGYVIPRLASGFIFAAEVTDEA